MSNENTITPGTLDGSELERLVSSAERGQADAMRRLKANFPRREFRRFWCDLRGTTLKWREKGSKAAWKRM